MSIRQLSVFIENKKGALKETTRILTENHVDIRALSMAETLNYGILRMIVTKPEEALRVLKDHNEAVKLTDVLAIQMKDEVGGLDGIVQSLAEEDISIEYLYAFISQKPGEACLVIRPDDAKKAEEVLSRAGYSELSEEEIL